MGQSCDNARRAGGTTIYLNGDSVFQAQDPQGDVINQSTKGIAIGFLENQSPYNPDIWMGGIDDVQIWDKALSGQQVKDWIFNKSGLSSDEYQQESSTHQLAHYEMNEGSGNILHDSSGKGNDAAVKKDCPLNLLPLPKIFKPTQVEMSILLVMREL